jgi:hypothetical protein
MLSPFQTPSLWAHLTGYPVQELLLPFPTHPCDIMTALSFLLSSVNVWEGTEEGKEKERE